MLRQSQIKSVLQCLSLHGNLRDLGKLCGSLDSSVYARFHKMVKVVYDDEKGGEQFEELLAKWAKQARSGLGEQGMDDGMMSEDEYQLAPMA